MYLQIYSLVLMGTLALQSQKKNSTCTGLVKKKPEVTERIWSGFLSSCFISAPVEDSGIIVT